MAASSRLPSLALRLPSLALHAFAALACEALSPSRCAACDAPASRDAVFCSVCARAVEPAEPHESLPYAFAVYGGTISVAIRRFKFSDRPDLARPLGHLLRRTVRAEGLGADVVVPVPLHPRRLSDRGYNQAALLARVVRTEVGAPIAARAIERVRSTAQQASLDRASRRSNVEGAFRVRDARAIRGKHVLLIDDVATTGSTLAACAAALHAEGACEVTPLVVARARLEGGEGP